MVGLHFVFHFVVVLGFFWTQVLPTEIGFSQNSLAQSCLSSLLILLAQYFVSVLFCAWAQYVQGDFPLNLPHSNI